MAEPGNQPTPQAPAAPVPTPPATPAAPAAEKQPPWGKPEDFNPEKAWELIQTLRADKAQRGASNETLNRRIEEMEKSIIPPDRLAAALGIRPEAMTEAEKVSKQIEELQSKILASERRALAAEHQIPEQFQHLLSAPDSDGLKKQAEQLVEFAKASAAAAAAMAPAPTPPSFQPNPGQGLGGAPLTPEAQAAAEYEKFYPSTPPRSA